MFYPEETATAYIMTEYARSLRNKYDITVICAGKGISLIPNAEDIAIERVFCPNWDKGKLVNRTFKFIVISLLLTCKLLLNVKKSDKVLTVTNPAPMLFFTALVKKFKGFELAIVVHDVFPENAIAAGIFASDKSFAFRTLKRIFDWSYSKADQLIVLGRDMQDIIKKKIRYKTSTNVMIIENWAESSIIHLKKKYSDKIVIQYAGNIGRVQGLMEFISCFGQANNPKIKFILRGGGAMEQDIKHYIKEHNLCNIELKGPYKRTEQTDILNDCDIALISLSPNMYGLGVPSKSYNIMASGKPILYIGNPNSEMSLTIREYGLGYCFDNGEREQLIEFLKSIDENFRNEFVAKGNEASKVCEAKYSYQTITSKINNLL